MVSRVSPLPSAFIVYTSNPAPQRSLPKAIFFRLCSKLGMSGMALVGVEGGARRFVALQAVDGDLNPTRVTPRLYLRKSLCLAPTAL